ncbi:hypothetical protein Dde_3553 [Oleidesulfovibrio alaskensis G20]|jgi:hypothetical protein|uniref:Uncharacterized protein n=1 Tax=Oleidesulfovibrio alaskensis (strain ATCC BAA-1058 / DSM 17464 / G20) TaxID=207559 RepID=Q30VF0_OLEA2|nr:hypothetical protein [Oleidesulfovibrio alaskensis]ABB40346.1 hypothetical protein Dde_3553 [Oleidesulfovibrio alaskensis G20]MBG0772852.1 hypothetical protein [Oleidesulfovibrio alaskensis]MBL3583540.1 hypothetical protein [Oleidesulfovibrio alaskensis]
MYVGIHTASLPFVFAEARRRIIMHAALYSNFARSPRHIEALSTALTKPGFRKLHAITLPFDPKRGWMEEFMHVLRPDYSLAQMEHEFNSSRDFLVRLAARHDGLVELYETRAMPCMPVIIVDDKILFGHYAHSPVPAPQGYWFSVTAPVEDMLDWLRHGRIPEDATPTQKASLRFVADCDYAMRNAKRLFL